MSLSRFLLSPEAGEGSSTTPSPTTTPAPAGKPDGGEALAILAKKNAELERDNANLRAKNRDLREKLDKAPGSAPLESADAAELASYRALGKPDELKAGLDERSSLKRDEELRGFMESANLDTTKLAAFRRLVGDATPEHKTEKDLKTGKDVDVFTVKIGDAKPVSLEQHLGVPLATFRSDGAPARPPATPNGNGGRYVGPDDTPANGRAGEAPLTPRQQVLKSGRYLGVR